MYELLTKISDAYIFELTKITFKLLFCLWDNKKFIKTTINQQHILHI